MAKSAVFIDLDRTLLAHASGQVLNKALVEEGVLPEGRGVPGDRLLYAVNDRLGENLFAMGLVRAAARVARGWSQEQVQAAGRRAVAALSELVAPFAPQRLAAFRAEGHRLVLSTTTPVDMIAPFAEAFGFDDLIATAYETRDGHYTGRLYEGFVWGTGKLRAVHEWADDHGVDLADCHACSDSIFDVPLLSSVGTPHAVNPDPSLHVVASARRWSVEHWDRPPGVPSVLGLEPYHMLRPFVRSLSFPYARFDIAGVEHVPARGPVLLAANHRSYFDVATLALVARAIGRPVRFLAKKEVFDAPVVGLIARAIGGIPVNRGSGSGQPLREAEAALKAGEVVIVLPQGTIPRGYDFFDPVLHGKTGTARLAASTGAPVVPVGLWGTERVWARSARTPDFTLVRNPPKVTVRVGRPVPLSLTDAVADTEAIMQAISALLPAESRVRHEPTPEELARTQASSVRTGLASAATRAVNAASRRLGRGQGTVAGGRAGLRVDPKLLEHLSAGRQIALVSGTNGKTTTTRLLTVALGASGDAVVSNETGSNMPPGHVAALAGTDAPRAVLEVDEVWLPRVLSATGAAAVVLLNLSRDQLDRTNEVRMVAGRWRAALAAAPRTHVVANADDPLVVWGAGAATDVHWVGAGLRWQHDAVGCPSCEGRIEFGEGGAWACRDCGFARPDVEVDLVAGAGAGAGGGAGDGDGVPTAVWADGRRRELRLALPGRFNQANALLAAVAAEACGIDAVAALDAMASVQEVAGRFTVRSFGTARARLMLAKNPAGWDELLDLVAGASSPLVVSINARVADGADPSWLWDVPFERLAGRTVVATGDRYRDLSVRLRYAEVAHSTDPSPVGAVTGAAAGDPDVLVDVIGNYTAFHDLLGLPGVSPLLRVAVLFPDLLGTYGDGGNGLILARRAQWRGVEVDLLQAVSDVPVPEADIYCLGGGEDGPQVRAARTLIDDGTLTRRVAGGAVVLAVCAGFQVVGRSFPGAAGEAHEGVGLLDIETVKGAGPRAVGEVVAEPVGLAETAGLPTLTGFENHGGMTARGEGTEALGRVTTGVGNGDGGEGAVQGRVVGTYLHGPVLARNPGLADVLLSWALDDAALTPLDDSAAESLREERLGSARRRTRAAPVAAVVMRTVLNILWFVLSGLWLAIGYVMVGVLLCVLIITIPFGIACFRLAAFVLWPFGRAVVRRPGAGAPSTIANVLWFVLAGLWMAIAHVILGIVLCITIIGIPLGLGNFKLAAVALAPLGKEIVRADDPRAREGAIVF